MEQWEKDLRGEIRDAFKSGPINPPKVNKIQIRPFLFFVAVFLMMMNFVILEQKRPGFVVDKASQCIAYFNHKNKLVQQEPQPDPLVIVLRGLDARIAALETKDYSDEELKAELKEWRDKVYLIAIVSDENAAISKKILSQYNHEGQEFIHIDPDWKINRMPSHITIGSEAREFLRERMR